MNPKATVTKPESGPRRRPSCQDLDGHCRSGRRYPGRRSEDDQCDLSADSGRQSRRSRSPGARRGRSDRGRSAFSPGPRAGRDHRGHDVACRDHRNGRDRSYRSDVDRDHRGDRDDSGGRRDLRDHREHGDHEGHRAQDYRRGRRISMDRDRDQDCYDGETGGPTGVRREQEDDRDRRDRRLPDRISGPPPFTPPPTTRSRAVSAPRVPGARHNPA